MYIICNVLHWTIIQEDIFIVKEIISFMVLSYVIIICVFILFYYSGSHKAFYMSIIFLYFTILTPFPPFHLSTFYISQSRFFPLDHFYFYSIFKYLTLCMHIKCRTEKWEQTYDICLIKTDLTQYAYLKLFIFCAHFN